MREHAQIRRESSVRIHFRPELRIRKWMSARALQRWPLQRFVAGQQVYNAANAELLSTLDAEAQDEGGEKRE
jgi:hypothetical protein